MTTNNQPVDGIKDDFEGLSIEEYINAIEGQTKLNGRIISLLTSKNLNKEQKKSLVGMLSENANGSMQIQDLMKRGQFAQLFTQEEIETIIPKKDNIGMIGKFKNLMMAFKEDLVPNVINRTMEKNWNEVGEVGVIKFVNSTNTTIKKIFEDVKNKAKEFKVLIKNTENEIYILGQRSKIKKLKKKYKHIFDLLSVDENKFLDNKLMLDDYLNQNIESYIEKKLGIKISEDKNNIDFKILEGLSSELKYEMLTKILSKEIFSHIKDIMILNDNLNTQKSENKYMEKLIDFSNKYELNPDLVVHSLRTNHETLMSYQGFENLVDDKEKILEANDHYANLLNKNLLFLNKLIKTQENIIKTSLEQPVSAEMKENFVNETENMIVFEKNGKTISFPTIQKNIEKISIKDLETKENVNKTIKGTHV